MEAISSAVSKEMEATSQKVNSIIYNIVLIFGISLRAEMTKIVHFVSMH